MENPHLLVSVEEHLATVRLHRPEKKNALSPDVLLEIHELFTALSRREDVRVVILTGGEEMFSAGFDLDFIRTLEKESNEEFVALFHQAYRSILFCAQPVIAAVGGSAIAGGFDLTLMCDIRYASEKARFGQREIVLALTPLIDPLWRIIGLGRAMEVALTGRIYDAAEAERMGYVSRVFPQGKLLESVIPIARTMAGYDRKTLVETKKLGHSLLNQDIDGAMKVQEWLFRSFIGSRENHERIDTLRAQLKDRKK